MNRRRAYSGEDMLLKTQRAVLRDIFNRCNGNPTLTISQYAEAERNGEVRRKKNESKMSHDAYATALFNDGIKKGWLRRDAPAPRSETKEGISKSGDPIVIAAQKAFASRLRGTSDVSQHTKNAQQIAKTWRSSVHKLDPDRFQIEAMVAPALDQKIDIVDLANGYAYEFKVSGKNAWAEFYKDVVKVIIWNRLRQRKLTRLIFITEGDSGRRHLGAPMPQAYMTHLRENGIAVDIEYVHATEQAKPG